MDARPDLQKVLSSPEHVEEHDELETWESLGGYSSPHQQWVPSERPRTSLPRPRQICWHEPAVTKLPLPWSSRGVPVAKQPMVDISDAATVAVGVGMETILDDEVVSCADAMARKAAAATADSDLMEIMLCVCVCASAGVWGGRVVGCRRVPLLGGFKERQGWGMGGSQRRTRSAMPSRWNCLKRCACGRWLVESGVAPFGVASERQGMWARGRLDPRARAADGNECGLIWTRSVVWMGWAMAVVMGGC